MATSSSALLSEKLAATLAEAVANLELLDKELDHDELKQLQAAEDEVEALRLEVEELEQARKDAARAARLEKQAERARLMGDEFVSDEAMQELEDAKTQLDLDRWNFENDSFQIKVFQAQMGGEAAISEEDKFRMIAARDLSIVSGETPEYWKWTSVLETRYAVAELLDGCWLEITGRIAASNLFPYTAYAAFFIFKLTDDSYGFNFPPVEAYAGNVDSEKSVTNVYLVSEEDQTGSKRADGYPKRRADGWMEVELGTFFVKGDMEDESEIEISLKEISGNNGKKGLIVLGIELRPALDETK
uniref:Uncharacterized protein n=1 Tax=Kalanchoe fedtschenkoi TaxID=63787 RepID=A0A7N1A5C9_KALFE